MKIFRYDQESKEMKERIQRIAIADSLGPSRVCLCLIAVLELYFLVAWLIFKHSFTEFNELRYFLCYVFLLVFSVIAFVLSFMFEKDRENGYKKLAVLQAVSAVLILLWTVVVTVFDADHHAEFSYIIYATIVVILPSVIYVNRTLLNVMYLLCDAVLILFTIIIKPEHTLGTILNFSVFAIVSLCACNLYKNTKIVSIKREIALQDLAERDQLTGLYNRQRLNAISQTLIQRNLKDKTALTCVMMDVDDFKQINDQYGHLTGDRVLEHVARVIREAAKENGGLTFRYGGEEFLIIFSDGGSCPACRVVEEIQSKLREGIPGLERPVSLSFGVYTSIPAAEDNIEQYYAAADDLLYASKKAGKNRYTAFEEVDRTVE